jgi:hypothetical protein
MKKNKIVWTWYAITRTLEKQTTNDEQAHHMSVEHMPLC